MNTDKDRAKAGGYGQTETNELAFEILISLKIFDRNSNVRFYQLMAATGLQKSPVYDLMHGPSHIKS